MKKPAPITIDELDLLDKSQAMAYTHTSEAQFDLKIYPYADTYMITNEVLFDKGNLYKLVKKMYRYVKRKKGLTEQS